MTDLSEAISTLDIKVEEMHSTSIYSPASTESGSSSSDAPSSKKLKSDAGAI